MHEASIVNNIIDLVQESVPPKELYLLDTIEIRMGKMCNVLPEALEFCFRSFIEHTPLEHLKLIIEEMNINIYCRDCTDIFESSDFIFNCPRCGSSNMEIIGGDELMISKLHLKNESELI